LCRESGRKIAAAAAKKMKKKVGCLFSTNPYSFAAALFQEHLSRTLPPPLLYCRFHAMKCFPEEPDTFPYFCINDKEDHTKRNKSARHPGIIA
jgi:hypothetical protein